MNAFNNVSVQHRKTLIDLANALPSQRVWVCNLCPGIDKDTQLIIKCIREQHNEGIAWSDKCVVYRATWMSEKLHQRMQEARLPAHWLRSKADKSKLSYAEATIKLMTIHSSKGLEFQLVIVSGVGSIPDQRSDVSTEAKLLYVAMTRATEKLLVTAHKRSEFADMLSA